MKKLKLVWEKSDRRYSAELGECSVSVRRFGRKGDYRWMVDDVFGARWQDDGNYETAEEAMVAAEEVALFLFKSFVERFARTKGSWVLTG